MDAQKPGFEGDVAVVGLARDCAPALSGTLTLCGALEEIFPKVNFVFVENSSTDLTPQLLEDWARQRRNASVVHPDNINENDSRTTRIAACRNAAMDVIRARWPNISFLFILDMDLSLAVEDTKHIKDALAFMFDKTDIAAVFPNSKPLYYDLFALRHPFWCPKDVWQDVDQAWRDWRTDDDHQTPPEDLFVRSRQLLIPTDLPPIKVESAFGGLGLYRWELAKNGVYRGVDDEGRPTCEHVEFHKSIPGDKYILPSWCIEAPREHLSSAFRTEYSHERELRRRRSRIAFRDKLIRKFPALRPVLTWAFR